MRELKRGEMQAIGSVSKLMIVGGIFVTLHSVWLDFKYSEFIKGFPGTLISGPFPTIFIATSIFLIGCVLAVWLHLAEKRTGLSTQPFKR